MGLWDRFTRRIDELAEGLLPDDLRDAVEGAKILLDRGELGAAAAALDAVLRQKPDHATARYLLGVTLLRQGRRARAIEELEQAAHDRPSFTEAIVAIAQAKLDSGDGAGAIAEAKRALDMGGASAALADAYRVLGLAHLAGGLADKGLRELRKALVEDPNDTESATALANELLARGADPAEARAALEKSDAPLALSARGRLANDPALLERALAGLTGKDRVPALVALAELTLAKRAHADAHRLLLEAISLDPRAAFYDRLGDVHLAVGNTDAALDSYERAAAWTKALDAAIAAGRDERATKFATMLDGDPRARAVTDGRRLLDAGETERAIEILRAALPWSASLLGEAFARQLDAAEPDLYALGARLAGARVIAELGVDLPAEATRALASYDQPLLVTVMGEFSSGKSSFVNAFLGAAVAPVGITPTTATINVLVYGVERGARVVYRDDRVRALAWDDVPDALKAVDADEARKIRLVEVVYPAPALREVSIVDTPGLNSILPEHEATARQFIAQADAIVWLFTVGQAGKATEKEALEKIRGEGRRVLGVINKIDQASPDEVARIVKLLEAELGGLVEALVPVSARRALAGHDPDWSRLLGELDERFFKQARQLKREALARRLRAILKRAHDAAAAQASDAARRTGELDRAQALLRTDAVILARQTLPDELKRLAARIADVYRAAAREVIELVRPRKTPFGSNRATGPDRDFLIGFLERELGRAIEDTAAVVDGEIERIADPIPRLAVFDRAIAFVAGYLRGGWIEEFFARTLPKLELSEDSVYHALVRSAPPLESVLEKPLLAAASDELGALAARRDAERTREDAVRAGADALAGVLATVLAKVTP